MGIFAGSEYAAWVRFSSDTVPTLGDYLSTLGVGLKLFGVSGSKAVGALSDTTFDFILQNFDVFFVDTAEDMCAFTRAGVVDGDYGPYLKAHPETAKLLDQMARPVASALATPYWSGLPFAFGPNRYVKYKLEPTITVPPPASAPSDPTYLAADLEQRLQTAEATFRFLVQFRTDPEKMPLDQATVRWDESESPFIHIADLILPQQSVADRGQAEYGENLSFNIWRATESHTPQGSLAEARRVVYEASAKLRRDVNGVPVGEPTDPRPSSINPPCEDSVIVRAAIHPAIGIARIGDSETEYFVGPEVLDPAGEVPGYYRDGAGALKRQVARFHIYGYNAAGEVVRELNPSNADIEWTVQLANKKAAWYQFQAALDITDAAAMTVPQRNKSVPDTERSKLVIDPGPRSISGTSTSGGKDHLFDTGKFKETVVPLGEIRTDENGCLLVFGGKGVSGSPSGAPIFRPDDGNSFNNADDWYDDISDGPVTATVSINGSPVPVSPAWVAVAPPNYAPQIVGWRTLYDLLVDVYTACGWMKLPDKPSFTRDILPVLKRLSNLQWVNKGFATMFGKGCPLDFNDPVLISKLAAVSDVKTKRDPYGELRQVIFNALRPASTQNGESLSYDTGLWPWIYGDSYGSFSTTAPNNNLPLPSVQQTLMRRWVAGEFIGDWDPLHTEPEKLADVPLSNQPKVLDQASLHFCLADAFHPGCELTWPVRHASMYESPFRIRHRAVDEPEPSYGATLAQQQVLQPGGPLYAQGAGDLSRWMALPWQGDTAFCRSGYDLEYDPYVPTFWPARVPNQVLTEKDYETVMNTHLSREDRIAAYNQRASWIRAFKGSVVQTMLQMVAHFGSLGVVEPRLGFKDDPDFPETIYVESLAGSRLRVEAMKAADLIATLDRPQTRLEQAGWESQEQLEEFRSVRIRHRN
ncbi:MAG: LodA/GoxA family CTQ-dependent oxidase [Acidobacteriaceae bacterium]